MLTKLDAAKQYISLNPDASYKEIVEATGCSIKTVSRAKSSIKNGADVKKGESSFRQDKDGAEYTFDSSTRIISKDDLVKACDIDLSQWIIERWVCNKWEVGAKDANKKIQVTPLFQIKLWLKPIHTEKQARLLDSIEDIVKKYTGGKLKSIKQTKIKHTKALKGTLSDMHVGLDPNPNGRSVYNYVYGEKQFNENLEKFYNSIVQEQAVHGKFDVLYITDLGDGLDGWNGLTTRGGHKLDQNLDNVEQFRVYVTGKLRLIEKLINSEVANKVIIYSVTDDNHAGDLAYVANMAIQMILERSYDKKSVEFVILKKFMEHFTYGDHTFILTHGKDAKNCFKGLPLKLDQKAIKVIEDYIKRFKITSKHILVEKGDLHQVAFEKTNAFTYRNFMSFAPPSAYSQNNFGDGYSGYSIQVIQKEGTISHTDYYFDVEISEE
jgi:hypothetical protein